jgi:hypothetical protein
MNEKLEYLKAKKISLKKHPQFNEKWLQIKIAEDPSILGLGDIRLIERERQVSSGGRIDFLLKDDDLNRLYEVEAQLGGTDETHIIRTIEYWDLEKRKNPSYEHRAVIIAESITNRFFNVIYLMNLSIPIIAIQLSALEIEGKIILDFTKVIDTYEIPEDEITIDTEVVGESYWQNKGFEAALDVMNEIIKISKQIKNDIKITYNKYHIALGTPRLNCVWFYLRKNNYCSINLRVNEEYVEEAKNQLEEIGALRTQRERGTYTLINISLKKEDLLNNKDILTKVLGMVISGSS